MAASTVRPGSLGQTGQQSGGAVAHHTPAEHRSPVVRLRKAAGPASARRGLSRHDQPAAPVTWM